MILCFIPARKGSKGVSGKNLKILNGKPLIEYTFEIAKKLKKFNFFPFISTDSKEIIKIGKKFGIYSNYIRPSKLSQDDSNIIDAVIDGISFLKRKNKSHFYDIILLEPTNPLRKLHEIITAYKFFKKKKLKSLFSVTKVREHPEETILLSNKKRWKFVVDRKNKKKKGRQFFSNNYYFIDGNFYISNIDFIFKHKSFVKKQISVPYKIDRTWPLDIDHADDFDVASVFLKKNK